MAALEITTQVLTVKNNLDLDSAIAQDNYKCRIERIDKIAPPNDFEKKIKGWELIKINKKNQNQKFRAVGCYLALYEEEYQERLNITEDISYKLKNYDYVITLKNSKYKEEMFY